MVAGEGCDLYAFDTYTWSTTSSAPGASDEPVVNNRSHLAPILVRGLPRVCNKCASLEHFVWCLMIDACARL
jgi:hypothetical protein